MISCIILVPGKYSKTGIKKIYGKTPAIVWPPMQTQNSYLRILLAWDEYASKPLLGEASVAYQQGDIVMQPTMNSTGFQRVPNRSQANLIFEGVSQPLLRSHPLASYHKISNNWAMHYVVGVASSGNVWCFFASLCPPEGLNSSFFAAIFAPFSR